MNHDLLLHTWNFFTYEAQVLASAREHAKANGFNLPTLEAQHRVALQRAQMARAAYFAALDGLHRLDPHPGFWENRPDIK